MLPGDRITAHQDASYLVRRGRVWQYRRRVPDALSVLDPRREVRVSTGTRDKVRAAVIAAQINQALEEHWGALLGREDAISAQSAVSRFNDAVAAAKAMGLSYLPASELAEVRLDQLVSRIEMLESRAAPPAPSIVTAVLGGATAPDLRLSGLFEAYETLVADRTLGKSPDQIRKWQASRQRAIAHLIDMIGDKRLADVTREDALNFRNWWIKRIRDEQYDQTSANKDLGCLSSMMRTIDEAWRLNLSLPFAGVRVAGEKHKPRIAYDPEFVRLRILPGTELADLNPEARAIVQIVAATGMRPSEVVALTPARIVLNAEIPHLQIRPDTRQLKNDHSARDMPLVGTAFAVMKAFPEGFPRYNASPDTLSATVNKALAAAGLRPTPGHTLYSLRHTFKDRLIALEVPQRIQDELMGHALREVAYGAGSSLKHRAAWLARVWG